MNVLIMADLEGISGIYTRDQVIPSLSRFHEGRKYLTKDINVCAAALKAAGVDKVYVRDCHGGSYALLWDEVSEDVDLVISGALKDVRFPFVEEYDAVILFGYHGMAGTDEALLEHTFSSVSVQNYHLNGEKVGEIAIDAAILAEHNTPVIMVSGDTNACLEAKRFLPWVAPAEVKRSLHCMGAGLLPPHKAKECIFAAVKEAVESFKAGKCELYRVSAPITLRVELTERNQLPTVSKCPYMKVIDGRTFEVEADSVEQAIFRV